MQPLRRFENRIAVITGSTAGIGLATAKRLLAEGCTVVISSRKTEQVQRTVDDLRSELDDAGAARVSGCVCHVGKADDRTSLFKHVEDTYGRLDVLVLNAAVSPPQPPMLETTSELFDKIMDVNVKACLLFVQEAAKILSKGGSITIVSSVGGFLPSAPHPAYGLSKTAVFGLTKALAIEFAGEGVRVNCCAPGMIKTGFSKPIWSNPSIEKKVAASTWLRRLGEPEEVAATIAFLASDDAAYITGEVLVVGGGTPASRI